MTHYNRAYTACEFRLPEDGVTLAEYVAAHPGQEYRIGRSSMGPSGERIDGERLVRLGGPASNVIVRHTTPDGALALWSLINTHAQPRHDSPYTHHARLFLADIIAAPHDGGTHD